MGKRPLEELNPGVVVAADVVVNGRVLLAKGAALSEASLKALANRGVGEVDVVEEAGQETPIDEATLNQSEGFAAHFFQFVNHRHPLFEQLYIWCVESLARKLVAGLTIPEPEHYLGVSAENPPYPDAFLRDEGGPEALVGADVPWASFPDAYYRILQVLDSPNSSASQVAEVISQDQSLAARLLKLVNSPFFGFSQRIDAITRAVILVGTKELATLAAGVAVIQVFKDVPPSLLDMRAYWTESLTTAVVTRQLVAESMGGGSESYFVAGLIATIGRLVALLRLPYAVGQAMLYSLANGVPLHIAERECLGFDQSKVTNLLLKLWRYPDSLRDIISRQYSPGLADDLKGAACLHVAQVVGAVMEVARGRMVVVPDLDPTAWTLLGLTPETVVRLTSEGQERVDEIVGVFLAEPA